MPTSKTKHTKSPIQTLETPSGRFQTVHIDIVGPFPPAKSPNNPYISQYRYVLTYIDRTARWIEARWIEAQTLSEITACNVAEAFINACITR